MRYKDQVVIVTGGADGIGGSISRSFSSEGAYIAIFDLHPEKSERMQEQIRREGGECSIHTVDVTDELSVNEAASEVVRRWGKIDVLVNNAGISNPKTAEQMNVREWQRVIDVNLSGAFICTKAVIEPMKQKGRGKIVNIASVGGKRISFAGGIAYTASKSGLIGLTRHLAYELIPYGINVNAVCPGGTMTPLYASITDENLLKERIDMIPAGRLCSPDDIADTVLFLSSDQAKMICGVSLDVDGGSLLGWMNVTKYYEKRNEIAQRRIQG